MKPVRSAWVLGAALFTISPASVWADSQITIIHIGDIHGHLAPRPNLRSSADYPDQMVGGLARMKSAIKDIQAGKGGAGNTLIANTGDTIQGSGEALYTRGQAMVDVLDEFGIDAYTPGNWDYVYGPDRFKELFVDNSNPAKPASRRWGAISTNLYNTSADPSAPLDPILVGTAQDANVSATEYAAFADWYVANGQRVLPPYRVKKVNGVVIGFLGCTTSRGPQVVGAWVTAGLTFTDCAREAPKFAAELRKKHKAEVVVLLSEIEIARNIQLVKNSVTTDDEHIDVILNSDMHEETLRPIEVTDGAGNTTWILEAGQDGTLIGEVTFSVHAGRVTGMDFVPHRIDDRITEDVSVARKVAEVSNPFNAGFTPNTHLNPFSGTYLTGPLSDVVGSTTIGLHRSNYSHEDMPAVIEGTSHDFIADAIRWWAQSDIATVRGFRYGTHVAPGPITRNDLFHFVPIGPRVGKVSRLSPNQMRNQFDNSSLAVFSSDPNNPTIPRLNYNNAYGTNPALATTSPGAGLPPKGGAGSPQGWGGGWLFAYSGDGFHFDFDPYMVQNLTYNADNSITATPVTNTSRARSFTLRLPCKYLPPAERVTNACNVNDLTTRYTTVLTNATDGRWTTNWVTPFGTAPNTGSTAMNVSLINADTWQYLPGLPNQPTTVNAAARPFQAPTITIAGYFYAQAPFTINNCNNCYPNGTSTVVGHPDAPYVLPINMGADGNAAIDALGNPLYVRDSGGNVIMENGKPKLVGEPIDLTLIMEKYLAHLGGEVNASNLPIHRIGLVQPLPDFTSTLGFPVMQPLCGTVGQNPLALNACP